MECFLMVGGLGATCHLIALLPTSRFLARDESVVLMFAAGSCYAV